MSELKKNQKFNAEIIDLSASGNGVAKINGEAVFVPGTLPGEEIEGVVINCKSKFAIGKMQKITRESENRVVPKCKYFLKCGGCGLQHLNYKSQLEFKREQVERLLGGRVKVQGTFSTGEYFYRNKVAFPVSDAGEIGMYRTGTHTVVPLDDCVICKPFAKKLLAAGKEIIAGGAKIKHVLARELSGKILITFVTENEKNVDTKMAIKVLDNYFDDYQLNLNINTLGNNVILSDKFVDIKGNGEIEHDALGVRVKVSNGSFFQVNEMVSEEIYRRVLQLIDNNSVVVDCYSGAGLLTAILSKRAKTCYGIEIVKSAIADADKLKAENHIYNMKNINGDCKIELPKLATKLAKEKVNIVVDPPRKGLDKSVILTIVSAKPVRVIYISCGPATLARDVAIFEENGYKLVSAQTFDMFPQTPHVETLAVLEPQSKTLPAKRKENAAKNKYFAFYDDVKIASDDEW